MRSGWVAAMVRSGKEEVVAEKLRSDFQLDSYYPIFSKWRKLPKHKAAKAGKSRELIRSPIIPGYVFIKQDKESASIPVREVDGLIGVLSFEGCPCYAKEEEILLLRDMENSGRFNELKQSKVKLNLDRLLGTEVEISVGPLSGFKGKVVKINRGGVVLDLGSCLATVDESSI